MFRPPVVVNLRAGTAGTGTVLPEVILFAKAEDPVSGNANILVPDLKGLVVIQIDRGVQAVLLQAHHFGQKFPAVGNRIFFEIVAKGEVAQHLKIGAMAVRFTDIFNIAGADALLARGDPVPGRLLFPGKPGLHGGHAAVDQQQARVVGRRDQRKTGQPQMALALKVAQEHLPQLIESVIWM